jgi:hypothetical protein
MKFVHVFLLGSLLGATTGAALAQDTPRNAMKPVSSCPRLDRITDWAVVDDRTVILRNGPLRFVAKTESSCPRLGTGNSLRFISSPDKKAIGEWRICGDVGDMVVSRDQPPCAVVSVQTVDAATYDRLAKAAKRRGSTANLPSATGAGKP